MNYKDYDSRIDFRSIDLTNAKANSAPPIIKASASAFNTDIFVTVSGINNGIANDATVMLDGQIIYSNYASYSPEGLLGPVLDRYNTPYVSGWSGFFCVDGHSPFGASVVFDRYDDGISHIGLKQELNGIYKVRLDVSSCIVYFDKL